LSDVLRGDGDYNKFIQWQNVTSEDSYRIYRCTWAGCSPSTLVTTVGAGVTSFTDTNGGAGFAPGSTLVYEVRPFRSGCPGLNCNDHTNFIPSAPTPTPTPPPWATPTPTPPPWATPTPTPTPAPTCPSATLSPDSFSLNVGQSQALIFISCDGADLTTDVDHVDFSSSDPGIASVSPAADYSYPFQTLVTGESVGGPETITANVYLRPDDGVLDGQGTAQVIVIAPEPWFQTQGGDVHTQGRIDDSIPGTATEPYFSLEGSQPGVVSYGGSAPDFGDGEVSSQGWLAHSTGKISGYSFFEARISSPEDLEENPSASRLNELDGFYKVEGNLTLPPGGGGVWNITSPDKKVVILVTGNLIVRRRVNVGTNNNFLAIIVRGDILIDPGVRDAGGNPALEGAYIADGTIETGTQGDPTSDDSFTGEGMFIAGGFNLQRDYRDATNSTDPAELFIFRPDLWINAPQELWIAHFTWQELAP